MTGTSEERRARDAPGVGWRPNERGAFRAHSVADAGRALARSEARGDDAAGDRPDRRHRRGHLRRWAVCRRRLQPAATNSRVCRTGGRGQPRPGCRGAPCRRLPGACAGPAGSFRRPDDGPPCRWRDPRKGRRRGRLVDGPTRVRLRAGCCGGPRWAVRRRRRLPASNRADRRCRARVRGPGRQGHPPPRRRCRLGAASAGAARRVTRHGRGRPAGAGPGDPARARGRPRPVCRSPALGMPVLVVGLRFDIRHRARRLGRRELAPAPARDLPGRRRPGPVRHGPLADRRSRDPPGRHRADRGDRGARRPRDDRPRRRRRGAAGRRQRSGTSGPSCDRAAWKTRSARWDGR